MIKYVHFLLGQSGEIKSKYCTSSAKDCFGSGQTVSVSFPKAFEKAPVVMIGFNLIDTDKQYNVRVRASVKDVTKSGFNVVFSPWGESITYQLGVNWIACP